LYSSNFGVSTKLTKDIPHFSFSTAHHSNQSLGPQFGEIILRRNTPSKSRPARLGYLKQARVVKEFKKRLGELVEITPAMQWLETLPWDRSDFIGDHRAGGWGYWTLPERGTIGVIFRDGTTSAFQWRSHRYGRTRPDVNRYLKWAFAEAANSIAVNYRRCPDRT
jgi:hypothetical protein